MQKHTLVALVENKPGVLNRVASLFRRRAFNIESLTVGHTEQQGVSRMTIVVDSNQTDSERVVANLYKQVNVIQVSDLSAVPMVSRDLALIKVSTQANQRSEIMQLVEVFRARIVDVANDSLIIEITGAEDKIDGLVDVLRRFGILEMVRTGVVAMGRGTVVAADPGSNGNGYKPALESLSLGM
jgi:acetolactate synthase-1/3 small subunit